MLTGIAVLASTVLIATGCGSDEASSEDTASTADTPAAQVATPASGDAAAQGEVIEVGAVAGQLKFDKTELEGKAGKVTFKFTNPDKIPHNLSIQQDGEVLGETALITEDTVELTVDLKAGEYDFICTPHESAGMVGTLSIT